MRRTNEGVAHALSYEEGWELCLLCPFFKVLPPALLTRGLELSHGGLLGFSPSGESWPLVSLLPTGFNNCKFGV